MSTPTRSPLLQAKERNNKWANVPPEIRVAGKAISNEMEKHGILEGTKVRVCVALDVSGSMESLYNSGQVQALLVKALGMSACLDDDGEIEIFPFGSSCSQYPVKANFNNFQTVINDQIWKNGKGCLNGTVYTGPLISICRSYFGTACTTKIKQTSELPVFAIFVTDGKPEDSHSDIRAYFEASSYQPIFWKIITLGKTGFELLQSIDDAPCGPGTRLMDNSDYKSVDNPQDLTAEMLVDELPGYLMEAYDTHALFKEPPTLDREVIRDEMARKEAGEQPKPFEKNQGCCVIS
jgi:hypothetical protein